MKIKGKTLYMNRIDLDHVLDVDMLEENKAMPPSELFLMGLRTELLMSGLELEGEEIGKVVISFDWEER